MNRRAPGRKIEIWGLSKGNLFALKPYLGRPYEGDHLCYINLFLSWPMYSPTPSAKAGSKDFVSWISTKDAYLDPCGSVFFLLRMSEAGFSLKKGARVERKTHICSIKSACLCSYHLYPRQFTCALPKQKNRAYQGPLNLWVCIRCWSISSCWGLRYKSIGEASLATLSGYGTNIYILLPPPIWKPLIQKHRIYYYYYM